MSNTIRRRCVATALSALLLLAACGDDDGGALQGNVIKDGVGCSITSVDRDPEKPEVDLSSVEATADGTEDEAADDPTGSTTATEDGEASEDSDGAEDEAADDEDGSDTTDTTVVDEPFPEVEKVDIVKGSDDACDAAKKPYLTLDMVGVKADGTEFVNTFGEERPITAQLGRGELISGLETGLAEMRVGGRRQMTIPPELAYGDDGSPEQGIGPGETLVFVVDLVAVGDVSSYCNENRAIPAAPEGTPGGETKPTTPIEMPLHPYEELTITTITPGDGPEVKEGDEVRFHYLGISCATGQQFDSSWDTGEPMEGVAGGDGLIEGFSKGLVGARVGEMRRVDIPAELGYGDDALTFLIQVTEIIPPDEDGDSESTDPAAEEGDGSEGADETETTDPPGSEATEATETTAGG